MRYDRLQPLDLPDSIHDTTIGVIGAGAVGSHVIDQFARIGTDLIIIDRDLLAPANLATSALYTESLVEEALPKAVAAEQAATQINSTIRVTAHTADLAPQNVQRLLADADILVDGTDNIETRRLINEYAVSESVPWVHAAALRESGQVMPIVPGETACFTCLAGHVDGAALDTCETAGLLPGTAAVTASHAVHAASGLLDGATSGLIRFKVGGTAQVLNVPRQENCPTCQDREFPQLLRERGAIATQLCGQNTYHVNPNLKNGLKLAEIAENLREVGKVDLNRHLLRFEGEARFTLFRDGRMIVDAASDAAAKSVYARFVGL